ncbi:MAG: hypothetical protein KDB18_08260, partial [Salinibacterium sp.]|nr:hypothetical protein [Salinibacterium sp.]
MTKTPEETLRDLLELGEQATDGVWFVFDGGRAECKQFIAYEDPRRPAVGTPLTLGAVWSGGAEETQPNAAFIAASKNALPALRSLLEEVEARNSDDMITVPRKSLLTVVRHIDVNAGPIHD